MINIELIIKNIIENIDLYLKEKDLKYDIINFNDYLKACYCFKEPDHFFKNIGKKLIYIFKENSDDIYNIKFIQKNNIIEETNIAFSFECIYINVEKEINFIKNIIHLFQYNNENCILKIIPLSNITSKSIYINLKLNILDNITDEINQLNIKNQCTYYPKTGKSKGIRCKNEVDNENRNINILLCNKHKRFNNI
jgi:hypothetical protein